jgi:DNA-binding beta-propeller fold protein YncE
MTDMALPADPALNLPTELPSPTPGSEGTEPADGSPEERRRRRRFVLLFLLLGGMLLMILLIIWYLLFRQPLPLPVPTVIDLPEYTTSLYGASNPIGVGTTSDGSRIYVAQSEGDRLVLVLDANGNEIGTAEPGTETGLDHVPVWVALDPLTDDLYVSDRPTGSVIVYDKDGTYLRTFSQAVRNPGWQPMGLAFDAAGNLYVANLAGLAARVEMYDRAGNLIRTFGDTDQLSFPNGIAVSKDGDLFVADSNNGRLLAYRPDGTLIAQVGRGVNEGKLGMPRGVAVDGSNRVYVGDATGQGISILQWTSGAGAKFDYLGFIGSYGVDDGHFNFPNGVAVDGRGRIYVGDSRNNRVQIWSY